MNRRASAFMVAVIAGALAPIVPAQAPGGDRAADRSTEFGVRFTPGMARSLAGSYVRDMLVRRYELDEAKVEQATESVARRIMAMAHRMDEADFARTLEMMVEQVMERQLEGGRSPQLQPKSAQAIGEALKPVMPALKELVGGIAQDVRPMLAPRQQLKFGADMLAFGTAMNAVEENLDRWSRGEAEPFENPFEPVREPTLDAGGRSRLYNRAEERARRAIEEGEWAEWKQYVEDAKKLYGFDPGQTAGADSILAECLERSARYTSSETWRREVERNRLWSNLLNGLHVPSFHPLRYRLERRYGRMVEPIHAIGEELKQRIDAIPTLAQRRAADERILQLLGERGYQETAPAETTESPAPEETVEEAAIQPGPPVPTEVFDEAGSANDDPADNVRMR